MKHNVSVSNLGTSKSLYKPLMTTLLIGLMFSGLLMLAAGIGAANALTPPQQIWSKHYGGSAGDNANAVIEASDGGYLIAGNTYSYGSKAYLVKTDAVGNLIWEKTYGGSSPATSIFFSIIPTSDGGYALTGSTGGVNDLWLVKLDADCNQVWSKTWGGGMNDQGYDLIQTSDGGYAIAGWTASYGAGSGDGWLIKTDASGNQQWNKTYGNTGQDQLRSIVQTTDGGYALAGKLNVGSVNNDRLWLVKTDASGNQQWNQTYGTNRGGAYKVINVGDGFAVLGITDIDTVFGNSGVACIVQTNSLGVQQWMQTYNQITSTAWMSGVRTSDNGFALVGTLKIAFNVQSGAIVKTDADGNFQWNQTLANYNQPTSGQDTLRAIIQSSDGGYVVAGTTTSGDYLISDLEVAKFVLPEYAFGALVGLCACFAAVASFAVYKKRQTRIVNSI
jgi:hypothetical protein